MSKSLISEDLRLMLCQQISHERYNAGFYMYVAAILRNKGLDKLSLIFLNQHDEEIEHSKQIYKFLTDMNAFVEVKDVPGVISSINSILDVANLYIDREIITTKLLEDIKDKSIEDQNGVAEEFLRMMVNQQRSELEESTTFLDNAELCGNDWYRVKVWNDSLS